VALPQAQVLGELVMEPINKALQEENGRLKIENEVLKERESSKNKEMLLKQELVDEYKARSKSVEEDIQRAKDEIQRGKDEIQRGKEENQRFRDDTQQLRNELSSLKEKEAAMKVEIEYLKRREEELRLERTTEIEYLKRREDESRTERIAERAMFQTMISSLMNGPEDRKRKRNDDEETK
jgi:chromosome segregation ATPase